MVQGLLQMLSQLPACIKKYLEKKKQIKYACRGESSCQPDSRPDTPLQGPVPARHLQALGVLRDSSNAHV